MNAPSFSSLCRVFPPEQARRLRRLMDGSTDPSVHPDVAAWIDRCHNRPSETELIMCAIDSELGGLGLEAIRGRYVDSYHQDIQAVYSNQGDTYAFTILLDHETGHFFVTTMGAWIEMHCISRELI